MQLLSALKDGQLLHLSLVISLSPSLYFSLSLPPSLPLSQDPDEGSVYYHPVYFQVNEEDKEQNPIVAKALYEFKKRRDDEMSFSKGAIITNIEKKEGGWWTGDLGRQKKKLFPANYVEEIDPASTQFDVDNQLGELQQGCIDLAGRFPGFGGWGVLGGQRGAGGPGAKDDNLVDKMGNFHNVYLTSLSPSLPT